MPPKDYRKNAFIASKGKRKKRKIQNKKKWQEEYIEERRVLNKGSWFEQECLESDYQENNKSKFKIDDYEIDVNSGSDEEISENKPCRWIVSFVELEEYLKETAVCRYCHSNLKIVENKNSRAGLVTKVRFECEDNCRESIRVRSFHTCKKQGQVYDINRLSVLGARMIGKGRQGLFKFCSVLGLAAPISSTCFSDHTRLLEEKARDLMEENLQGAASRVREIESSCLEEKEDEVSEKKIIDVATCFDGTWNARGWSARDGVVTAISEGTSQVLDVIYKTTFCKECKTMESKKAQGTMSHFEYLSWYVEHEPTCFLNHFGSAQVFFIIFILY